MRGYHEFTTKAAAAERHTAATRLGWHPFSLFQTARGTWAFWVP